MEQIELIKAEIERLLTLPEIGFEDGSAEHGYKVALRDVKNFINSLPEEPKFKVGDMVVSTNNPSLTYKVLQVGLLNELGKLDYEVEIFTDGKAGIQVGNKSKEHNIHLISCDKMDEWGKLIPEEPSGLDNSKMPVDRWKEACKAACSDRNYRSHYGMTETRDDYFVDGVQWADEHPYKEPVSKELEKVAVEYAGKVGDLGGSYNHYYDGFITGAQWQKEMDKKSFILLKKWFEDIQEKSFRLTSGNVSHLGATIRCFAKNCKEYITDLL